MDEVGRNARYVSKLIDKFREIESQMKVAR